MTPPTIVCPANVTLAADANCSSEMGTYSAASVSDNCSASPAVTQTPAATTILSGHNDSENVTLTANDGNGNTASCSFTVTLLDITPPVLICQPYTATLDANGAVGITPANVLQSSADNCGTVNITGVTPSAFTCANLGANTVVLTANDGTGNTASCSAVVTVADQIPPTMLCQPLTVALSAAGSASITASQVDNGSTDNCTLVSLSVAPSVFNCANLGQNTVTLTGTDQSGNTATCQTTVAVVDNIAPTMLCKNATIGLNAAGQATLLVSDVNNGSFDNCTIVNISLSQTLFTCANLGTNTVKLIGTDQSGNSAQCTATVMVLDLIAPIALCKNAIANIGPNGSVTIQPALINNGSSDNCTFGLTVFPTVFNCSNLGMNTVILKATDSSGNMNTCTAKVTVKDVTPPTILCQNTTIFLDSLGNATLLPSQVNGGSSDNCTIASLIVDYTAFNCSDIGAPVNILLKATDQSGNTATCSAAVTVKDLLPPTAVCLDVSVSSARGYVTVYGSQLALPSFDNCDVWTYSPIVKTYTSANIGVNYLPITVKDYSNNTATCVSTVTVEPNSINGQTANRDQDTEPDKLDFLMYPNPTSGFVNLRFEAVEVIPCSLRIFDLQGKLTKEAFWQSVKGENDLPLDISGLPAGLYLVEFRQGEEQRFKRLMIQE
ncbi:MAG: HYR domain-containing protein [Lewinellaceae bacterium]|nr:HYR domain-containing protein [Lewinellaceae bacterium]